MFCIEKNPIAFANQVSYYMASIYQQIITPSGKYSKQQSVPLLLITIHFFFTVFGNGVRETSNEFFLYRKNEHTKI